MSSHHNVDFTLVCKTFTMFEELEVFIANPVYTSRNMDYKKDIIGFTIEISILFSIKMQKQKSHTAFYMIVISAHRKNGFDKRSKILAGYRSEK